MALLDYLLDCVLPGSNLLTYLVFVLVFLLVYSYVKKQEWKGLPPGPFCFPLLGSLPFLGSDIREPLRKLGRKYGDLFTIYLGDRRVVILNSYEVVREAFVRQGLAFSNRPEVFFSTELAKGNGDVSSHGELWKEHRRFRHTVLKDFGVGRSLMEDSIVEECQCLTKYLENMANQPYNPKYIIQITVSNIICSVVFGRRYEYADEDFNLCMKIMNFEVVGNSGILTVFPWLIRLKNLPGDPLGIKGVKDNMDFMQKEFKDMIAKHRESTNYDEKPRDLIDAYVRVIEKEKDKPGTTYPDEQLIQIIGDLFGAGTETTTTTLLHAFILMMQNPDVQENVQREIGDVIGRARAPSMRDAVNMPCTQACIHEIQRVADIVPLGVPHSTSEEVILKGYRIPAGTMVISSLYSIHRDMDIWPDPFHFDPKRFLDAEGNFIKREQLIPFSMGKRVCLGERLARMELFLFFVTLNQMFSVSFPKGHMMPSTVGKLSLTNMPKPFHVQLKHR